jgi:hypothetical protein
METERMTKADALEERVINFAVRILKLSANLSKTTAGKHIAGRSSDPVPLLLRITGKREARKAIPTLSINSE